MRHVAALDEQKISDDNLRWYSGIKAELAKYRIPIDDISKFAIVLLFCYIDIGIIHTDHRAWKQKYMLFLLSKYSFLLPKLRLKFSVLEASAKKDAKCGI